VDQSLDRTERIALGPGHDRRLLARVFREHGRLHIPDILEDGAARRLHHCLAEETPWNTLFNSGEKIYDLSPHAFVGLGEARRRHLMAAVAANARQGFQYHYDNHRLSEAGEPYAERSHFFARAVAFLNGPEFLAFAREVTGMADIALADAQATAYGPGHFLTRHDDLLPEKKRRAAYVLSMTPGWRAEWGGLLAFLDADGHVAEGYVPAFNALNLLRVPQPHFVSEVASYAGGLRYSIAGWLRAR